MLPMKHIALKKFIQLHQDLTAEKHSLESSLAAINRALGGAVVAAPAPEKVKRGRRKMSASARALIAAAQKARWAKVRAGKPEAPAPKRKKHTMSAAGRARIAAAQRARWAKLKAEKK
jgi:hypothetical protein